VGDWVSRAWKYTPVIANADTFGNSWWVWWLDINPAWRRDTRPLLHGTGPWDCLDLHGQNAFLNVLVSLKWWRDALSGPSPDWEDSVADVTWVLDEMEKCIILFIPWFDRLKPRHRDSANEGTRSTATPPPLGARLPCQHQVQAKTGKNRLQQRTGKEAPRMLFLQESPTSPPATIHHRT
jgi:hypothetical protein